MSTCSVERCSFFANEGCEGTCSQHAQGKCVVLLYGTPLPSDVLYAIWKYTGPETNKVLTDDEILSRLRWNPDSTFISSEWVTERLFFIRHMNYFLPPANTTKELFSFPEDKKLRKEDAERIMMMMDELMDKGRFFCRISVEKVIVQHTFHRGALDRSMFPVGLCYFGAPACTAKMTPEQIQNILWGVQPPAAGGGGGGGGGL